MIQKAPANPPKKKKDLKEQKDDDIEPAERPEPILVAEFTYNSGCDGKRGIINFKSIK